MISRPVRVLLFLILLTSSATAEPPRAVLTGPVDGLPGDFIDLDASDSIADHFLWSIEPARFPDGRKTFKVSPDGKSCQLASRPGSYSVLLVVSNSEGPALVRHQVTITGPLLPPIIPPTIPPVIPPVSPPVTPPVTPPNKPTTMADWVTSTATEKVGADPERAKTAALLAQGYRTWARNGAAAKDAREYARGQAVLNQAILQQRGQVEAWKPFFEALSGNLAGLSLSTVQQQIDVWNEVATGLEAVQ